MTLLSETNYTFTVGPGTGDDTTRVPVSDLWSVFPELDSGQTPREFAEQLKRAADYNRQVIAYVDLREDFENNILVSPELNLKTTISSKETD